MGTRALIGKVLPNGRYEYITCWYNGSLENLGAELINSWCSALKIDQLIRFGDISTILKYPYVKTSEGKRNVITDVGDGESTISSVNGELRNCSADYMYVWDDGVLSGGECGNEGGLMPLRTTKKMRGHKSTPKSRTPRVNVRAMF